MAIKFNKKAISQGSAIALVVAVLGGGYLYLNSSSGSVGSILPAQSVDNSVSVSSGVPDFYVSTLTATNTSLFTITTSGVGENTNYLIEVDKDVLGNSARTETFSVGVTQNVVGTSGKNTIENYQKVFVPFKSDYVMKDISDVGHTILSFSSSTFDNKKAFQTLTMQGATEIVKTFSLNINPNSADLTTLSAINDIGESQLIDFNFGQINKITLDIKN